MNRNFLIVLVLALSSYSCMFTQTEVGHIEIKKLTEDEFFIYESDVVKVESGDKIYFWGKLDIEYETPINLLLQVQIINDNGENLGKLEMNPMITDTRIMCIENQIGNSVSYSCEGRIKDFLIPESYDFMEFEDGGNYSFKAVLTDENSSITKFNECKIILKK